MGGEGQGIAFIALDDWLDGWCLSLQDSRAQDKGPDRPERLEMDWTDADGVIYPAFSVRGATVVNQSPRLGKHSVTFPSLLCNYPTLDSLTMYYYSVGSH